METKDLWKKIKEFLISLDINPEIYDQYLKKTQLNSIDEDNYAIVVSSEFAKGLLADQKSEINKKINELLGRKVGFEFLTKKEFESRTLFKKVEKKNNITDETFENFIEGPSNSEALKAVKSVIDDKFGVWSPLFLYGDSGLGKTHLLKATINEINVKTNKKALYYESNNFRNEIVNILQQNQNIIEGMATFNQKIKTVDYLLIDDVQFLGSSTKVNEILFDIINDLIKQKKQIILTSDKYPNMLYGFERRMVSRFSGGLNIQIKNLDKETSMRILNYKLKVAGIVMDNDVKDYITTYYANDVRKINSIMNKIDFKVIQDDFELPIKMSDLESLLSSEVQICDGKVTYNVIKQAVAQEYNTTVKILEGKTRTQPFTFARHVAMYLSSELLKANYTEIGMEFGGRDHSTVMNGIKKVEEKLKDKDFLKVYKKIKKTLSK